MSGRAQLMWDEEVTGYDFGAGHPMDPVRLALTMRLVQAYGLDRAVHVVAAKPAGESTLRLVHGQEYIEAVRRASAAPEFGGWFVRPGRSTIRPSRGCTRRPR
ncbi:hypothetical protein SANTM175S_06430 [Streptomyces antimycoticus]